jgi:DNA repair protein NreA
MPVGVWQIREGVREALKKENRQFESFENALSFACMNLSASRKEWIRNSKIYKNAKEQMKITDFFSTNKNA